ncbi:kinesin-related protein 10-like isoform X2 [Panonychus citri]|uniref:kinesin-related protein 10-like isoform X2 n=1 Tax=Panonychus citri TaxID=50023 RepID=UPI002307DF33|nr:kinesin-related protein 10-like isoform X2 [Panonychus citri]XP_053201066.1 kinesin-related protein 10-like isoform X2 [Panonychus citri]XP_053201068.1 kinesin-related protein 10-like isoform X2 [Panonychus citri]XP_053201069.1 kinesin-related protein 10-like isoform X2 [Panonychus citri]
MSKSDKQKAIGCMGANRMNERLLGLYWQILLVLLIGDIVVGTIWLFRYNLLLTNLRSDLIYRLDNDYGFDTDFQELWDRVQSEHQCCGIDTPYDYNVTQWFEREHATYEGSPFLVPQSCCAYHQFPLIETIDGSRGVDEGLGNNNGIGTSPSAISDVTISKEEIDSRSSTSKSLQDNGDTNAIGGGGGGGGGIRGRGRGGGGNGGDSFLTSRTTSADCMDSYRPENIYTNGCYAQILEWLQSSVDCLSVCGFCVITFLKLCFAFILRYEIREMIQKINLIKGDKERNDSTALQNLEAYLPRPSIQPDQPLLSNQSPHSQSNNTNNNTTNINIDNSNSNSNPNPTNNNTNSNNVNNSNITITANKRNRISTTNQSSFNSSIGSYVSCGGGDSTTINIPSRQSPQSIGTLGITFSSSLTTSPPTNRLIISTTTTTTTTTVTTSTSTSKSPMLISKSTNKQSTIVSTTKTSPTSPVTLITTVTNCSSGAATNILPPTSSSIVNPSQLLGLISLPITGDNKSNNNKSKSFNNSNNNNTNQVVVTNF